MTLDEVSGQFSRLHLELDPTVAGLTSGELAERLRAGSPSIVVREATAGVLQLDLRLVTDETADLVVAAIAGALREARPATAVASHR